MREEQEHDLENRPAPQHRCGNLFGCGDEKGTGVLREDIVAVASPKPVTERLLHMDEVDQQNLDGVSFRVTQVVDIVRGVHAMIPKSLFTPELQRQITVV